MLRNEEVTKAVSHGLKMYLQYNAPTMGLHRTYLSLSLYFTKNKIISYKINNAVRNPRLPCVNSRPIFHSIRKLRTTMRCAVDVTATTTCCGRRLRCITEEMKNTKHRHFVLLKINNNNYRHIVHIVLVHIIRRVVYVYL